MPRETVDEVVRRHLNGQKPGAIADALRLSKRTVYRYLAQPEPAPMRRIRQAVESWPDVEVLNESQRDELVQWLYDALTGWQA